MSHEKRGDQPIKNCASCPLNAGAYGTLCKGFTRMRTIPGKVDIDVTRPKWCPLPITIKGAPR